MNLELKNCNSTQFIIDLYISTFIFSKYIIIKKRKPLIKKSIVYYYTKNKTNLQINVNH